LPRSSRTTERSERRGRAGATPPRPARGPAIPRCRRSGKPVPRRGDTRMRTVRDRAGCERRGRPARRGRGRPAALARRIARRDALCWAPREIPRGLKRISAMDTIRGKGRQAAAELSRIPNPGPPRIGKMKTPPAGNGCRTCQPQHCRRGWGIRLASTSRSGASTWVLSNGWRTEY
jgi:hypothetical protein